MAEAWDTPTAQTRGGPGTIQCSADTCPGIPPAAPPETPLTVLVGLRHGVLSCVDTFGTCSSYLVAQQVFVRQP